MERTHPLEKISLPAQAAARLREGIEGGRWADELPSEAELCREFGVSRMTLRKAIAHLVAERTIIPGGPGRHHRLGRKPRSVPKTAGRVVRVLSPFPIYSLGSAQHVMLETVTERLASESYPVEYEYRPRLFERHSPRELQRLTERSDTAVWILFFATEPMQRWFVTSQIPCLAFGRLYEERALPCVSIDLPASSRHAVGLFYQRGHREMVYLRARFTSLTDRISAEAFANEALKLGARAQIIIHEREPVDLRRNLERLLSSDPRPTAFFSSCPEHCLTVLCHCREAGLSVPRDVSIIAGLDDEFLQFAVPNFACYRPDPRKAGRKIAMFILDMIRDGSRERRAASILPVFAAGGTLGPVPVDAVRPQMEEAGVRIV